VLGACRWAILRVVIPSFNFSPLISSPDFSSGNGKHEAQPFRSGKTVAPKIQRFRMISFIFRGLELRAPLAIPMHGALRRAQIVFSNRRPLLWYRGVRRAIEVLAFIGGAALLSYVVLRLRW
jgi:hypothetical protein